MPSAAVLHRASDRVIVLERRYVHGHGTVARLRALPRRIAAVPEGATLHTQLLAEFCPAEAATDNFEGLALSASETTMWMLSDDNFKPHQRTLLYELALPDTIHVPMEHWAPPPDLTRCAAIGASTSSASALNLVAEGGAFGIANSVGVSLLVLGAIALAVRRLGVHNHKRAAVL